MIKTKTPDILFSNLFTAVQSSGLFSDSKTFVDCRPKRSAKEINAEFSRLKDHPDFDLKTFVEAHFDLPKQYSSDFKTNPGDTPETHVERLWPFLTRSADKTTHPDDSLIPLPFPYIVPGGRFGEIYYWDSYFTMLGLEISGHGEMIENMVKNFTWFIETYGHIPNGNRTYFLSRSQPPFYALMVKLLSTLKGGIISPTTVKAMEKESNFWNSGERRVQYDGSWANRYWDDNPVPRQESYKEDVELVQSAKNPEKLYRDIRAACESGWDFSARWFGDPDDMASIRTTEIIPVDLMCLLYNLEITLSEAFDQVQDPGKAKDYAARAQKRMSFIKEKMWNTERGIFEDVHIGWQKTTGIPSLAMMFPLFFNIADDDQARSVSEFITNHFLKAGGVVSTPVHSGQQWDAPNGWAPLQWICIKGLDNYGFQKLARDIAHRWVRINEKKFRTTGKFVEKYDVENIDSAAGGGEYPVQDGFGWTNGVYLKILNYLNS